MLEYNEIVALSNKVASGMNAIAIATDCLKKGYDDLNEVREALLKEKPIPYLIKSNEGN